MKELAIIENECKIDLARRILAEKNGAFSKILQCSKKFQSNADVRDQCLDTMAALTEGYPDILTVEGLEWLSNILDAVSFSLFFPFLIDPAIY